MNSDITCEVNVRSITDDQVSLYKEVKKHIQMYNFLFETDIIMISFRKLSRYHEFNKSFSNIIDHIDNLNMRINLGENINPMIALVMTEDDLIIAKMLESDLVSKFNIVR